MATTPRKCKGGDAAPCLVRPGTAADLPSIASVQSASPEAAQWVPADYLDHDLRVAVCGDRVAGFLVARQVADAECEILNLAVAPEFRRAGVGKTLVRSFLESSQAIVFLEVRASNKAARQLYKSLGFQELTLRPNYYDSPPDTGVVMKFRSC